MRLIGIILTICMLLCVTCIYAQTTDTTKREQTLVQEEFNDNHSNWTIVNHGDSAFTKVSDGHYILNNRNANRFWALRMGLNRPAYQPLQLEMTLKLLSEESDLVAYGMIWNTVQKASNIFDEYRFLVTKNGGFVISQRIGGEDYLLKPWTPCKCVKTNGYNLLRVHQATDSVHRFYINDELVFQKKLTLTNLWVIGFYLDAHTVLYVDRLKISVKQ